MTNQKRPSSGGSSGRVIHVNDGMNVSAWANQYQPSTSASSTATGAK